MFSLFEEQVTSNTLSAPFTELLYTTVNGPTTEQEKDIRIAIQYESLTVQNTAGGVGPLAHLLRSASLRANLNRVHSTVI